MSARINLMLLTVKRGEHGVSTIRASVTVRFWSFLADAELGLDLLGAFGGAATVVSGGASRPTTSSIRSPVLPPAERARSR